MAKINKEVGMKNRPMMSAGRKRLVRPFRRQQLRKCIGCILSEVTYGNKGQNIWSEIPNTFGKKPPAKLQRDVRGTINLNELCCDIYLPYYCYDFH